MIQYDRTENTLWLFTIKEFDKLPDGIWLESLGGYKVMKGRDHIDMDTRFGYIAFGVRNPNNHPEAELFLTFMLSS